MSPPEGTAAAFAGIPSIPRDTDGPVFPAPWAARAFALTVALEEHGTFTWGEWATSLGPAVAAETAADAADREAYWRAWLLTLETVLSRKAVAAPGDLLALQEDWRRAAETTPHGAPIELPSERRRRNRVSSRAQS